MEITTKHHCLIWYRIPIRHLKSSIPISYAHDVYLVLMITQGWNSACVSMRAILRDALSVSAWLGVHVDTQHSQCLFHQIDGPFQIRTSTAIQCSVRAHDNVVVGRVTKHQCRIRRLANTRFGRPVSFVTVISSHFLSGPYDGIHTCSTHRRLREAHDLHNKQDCHLSVFLPLLHRCSTAISLKNCSHIRKI